MRAGPNGVRARGAGSSRFAVGAGSRSPAARVPSRSATRSIRAADRSMRAGRSPRPSSRSRRPRRLFELHRLRIEDAARGRVAPDRPAVSQPGDWPGDRLGAVRDRADPGHRRGGGGPRGPLQRRWPGGHERPPRPRGGARAQPPSPAAPRRRARARLPDPPGEPPRRRRLDHRRGPELGNLLSDVPVLEVLDPGGTWPDPDRPLHLRGFVIEAFDEDGVPRERAGPRTVERADGDGWIRRAAAPSGDAISRREVELEVRSRPRAGAGLRPQRLAAAEVTTIARDTSSEALYLDALEERRAVRVAHPFRTS